MKHIARLALTLLSLAFTGSSAASPADMDKPIIVIGASYSNGSVPFNDALVSPLFGIAVGFGNYLSLGDALIKDPRLPGYVINEAQAGATTFDRPGCMPSAPSCDLGMWQDYEKQLQKAQQRVTIPGTTTILSKYVVITIPNDCLHAGAFSIPQNQTTHCSLGEINAYLDRLLAVGRKALNAGLIPIYDRYPAYSDLDLRYFAATYGLSWAADEGYYNMLRDLHRQRLTTELPGAVVLDIWANFEHVGDGIHPNDKTSRKAAAMIAQYINNAH